MLRTYLLKSLQTIDVDKVWSIDSRFFRSDTAHVAELRALAALGAQYLRYKIAQKMD